MAVVIKLGLETGAMERAIKELASEGARRAIADAQAKVLERMSVEAALRIAPVER